MNDFSFVQVLQPRENLAHKLAHESLFEGPVIREQSSDRSSWHVLEENVEMGRVGRGIEVLDDV